MKLRRIFIFLLTTFTIFALASCTKPEAKTSRMTDNNLKISDLLRFKKTTTTYLQDEVTIPDGHTVLGVSSDKKYIYSMKKTATENVLFLYNMQDGKKVTYNLNVNEKIMKNASFNYDFDSCFVTKNNDTKTYKIYSSVEERTIKTIASEKDGTQIIFSRKVNKYRTELGYEEHQVLKFNDLDNKFYEQYLLKGGFLVDATQTLKLEKQYKRTFADAYLLKENKIYVYHLDDSNKVYDIINLNYAVTSNTAPDIETTVLGNGNLFISIMRYFEVNLANDFDNDLEYDFRIKGQKERYLYNCYVYDYKNKKLNEIKANYLINDIVLLNKDFNKNNKNIVYYFDIKDKVLDSQRKVAVVDNDFKNFVNPSLQVSNYLLKKPIMVNDNEYYVKDQNLLIDNTGKTIKFFSANSLLRNDKILSSNAIYDVKEKKEIHSNLHLVSPLCNNVFLTTDNKKTIYVSVNGVINVIDTKLLFVNLALNYSHFKTDDKHYYFDKNSFLIKEYSALTLPTSFYPFLINNEFSSLEAKYVINCVKEVASDGKVTIYLSKEVTPKLS